MSHWNYRIIRHRHKTHPWYGLHEVYYTARGKIRMWSPEPEVVGDGSGGKMEIVRALAMMLRDATNDRLLVLEEKDLPGASKKRKRK